MKLPGTLRDWVTAMWSSKQGKPLIINILADGNVPEAVIQAVFRRIQKLHLRSADPVSVLVEALQQVATSAIAGPDAKLPIMALVTRFTRLSRIADQEEARRRAYTKAKLLRRPERLQELRRIRVGYPPRQIVWVALEEPIARDLSSATGLTEVLDRLGMEPPSGPMVQITYNSADAPAPIKVPTTFDAGVLERFRPSAKGSPYGTTWPVSEKGTGYPECVHRGCMLTSPTLRLHRPATRTR